MIRASNSFIRLLTPASLLLLCCAALAVTPDDAGKQLLKQAQKLRQEHRYADAIAAYTDVIGWPMMPADVVNEARLEKTRATVEKSEYENPGGWKAMVQTAAGFWLTSIKAIATVILWIAVFAAAALIVVLARYLVPARQGLLIDLRDLSAADRDSGSRMLCSEIAQLLTSSPDSNLNDELILESGADGGGSAAIRPMVQLPGLDSVLSPSANVSIGPLQFTPAAVLALLRNVAQPRYERSVTGALFTQNGRTVIMAQAVEKNGRKVAEGSWQIGVDGADARQTVLRRIAARVIVLQAKGKGVTANARSLENVLEGMGRLSGLTGVPSEDALRSAAQCFQTALAYDPDNWVARFNLSVLSRQLSDHEFAIQNCETLEASMKAAAAGSPLKSYIEAHPSFPDSVRYNRALALSKIPNWTANKAAIELLDSVITSREPVLPLLAKSAKATALLFQFERFRESNAKDRVDAVREEILKIADDLQQVPDPKTPARALAAARSVALNSKGALLAAAGDKLNARAALEAASALQPNFLDPHIYLGRLYRRAQKSIAEDWAVRAKGHLTTALTLQPNNREANYQMGRLLDSDAIRDFAGALQCFEKAAPHSMAAYFAGEIYFNADFAGADPAKGLSQLRASVSLAPSRDFRIATLADRLIEQARQVAETARSTLAQLIALTPRQPNSPLPPDVQKLCDRAGQYLDEAKRAASQLARAGSTHDKERAAKQLQSAADAKTEIPV